MEKVTREWLNRNGQCRDISFIEKDGKVRASRCLVVKVSDIERLDK